MDIQLEKDIEFLLSFAPVEKAEDVPEGLAPMFYFSGTYEGDVAIANRIEEIKSRYVNSQNTSDSSK